MCPGKLLLLESKKNWSQTKNAYCRWNGKEKGKLYQSTWKLRRPQKNNALCIFKKNQAFLAWRDFVTFSSAATQIKETWCSLEAWSQYCKTWESSSPIQKLWMKRKPRLVSEHFSPPASSLSIKTAQCNKPSVNTARKLLFCNAPIKGQCFDTG